jgi:hypothetical protein
VTPELTRMIRQPERSFGSLAFSVPARSRLVELAVGQLDDVLLGTATVSDPADGGLPVQVRLHPRRPVDLPIVSASPAAYLTRLPARHYRSTSAGSK